MLRQSLRILLAIFFSIFLLSAFAQAQMDPGAGVPDAVPVAIEPGASDAGGHLSPMQMYDAAQPIVKGIIIVLLLCSVLTWTICIVKLLQLFVAMRRVLREQTLLLPAVSLVDCRKVIRTWSHVHAASPLLEEIDDELCHSGGTIDGDLKGRVEYRLQRRANERVQHLRYGIGPLATIGSVAPFIGLFGTVWGIMDSFIGIAAAKTVSLAVVAPGIAEALFATAIGLVAAIPAVVLHNFFLRKLTAYQTRVSNLVTLLFLMFRRDVSLNRPLFEHEPGAAGLPLSGN